MARSDTQDIGQNFQINIEKTTTAHLTLYLSPTARLKYAICD